MPIATESPAARSLRPPPAVVVLTSLTPDRQAIGRTARELGYRAIEAADPWEVLALLAARPAAAQLLLVEVRLPRMDGGEVIERARDRAPGLRTAFLSDDPEGADAALIRAYPEVVVLETPLDPRTLRAVLRAALGRPAAAPARRGPPIRAPRASGRHLRTW